MKLDIKGFVDISLVDWDGKVSSVIFLPYCNLRCPFCQNAKLVLYPEELPTISFEEIEGRLVRIKNWIDGVVITGGEPTLHKDLPILCKKLKDLKFKVKLDTNGTNPETLRMLIEKRLVDYIAMDIKAPLNEQKYAEVTGTTNRSLFEKILGSMKILQRGTIKYEFRTTVVPFIHTEQDIKEICKVLRECKRFVIQNFRPGKETIDPKFQKVKPFSRAELENFVRIAREYVPKVVLRG
jgi:pyruvate formate lyase activating enzyme